MTFKLGLYSCAPHFHQPGFIMTLTHEYPRVKNCPLHYMHSHSCYKSEVQVVYSFLLSTCACVHGTAVRKHPRQGVRLMFPLQRNVL